MFISANKQQLVLSGASRKTNINVIITHLVKNIPAHSRQGSEWIPLLRMFFKPFFDLLVIDVVTYQTTLADLDLHMLQKHLGCFSQSVYQRHSYPIVQYVRYKYRHHS